MKQPDLSHHRGTTERSGSLTIIAGAAEDPAPRPLVNPRRPATRTGAPGDRLHARVTGRGDGVTSWQQRPGRGRAVKGDHMSVYRVTEIIGTSSNSWEDAAAEAIRTASGTIRGLRVAEVVQQDIALDEGGAITYRTKIQLSFKYEPGS